MGIDLIRGGRIANRGFRTTKSTNSYLKSLINVRKHIRSFTLSCNAGLMLSSIKLFTRDLISLDLIVIPFRSPESSSTFLAIALPSLREKLNSIRES